MTKIVLEKKARQGGWGRHGLMILLSALLLTAIAWGAAELYGQHAKTAATEQDGSRSSSAPDSPPGDPVKSKTESINGEPADQNPKVDRNPTSQSPTGG